jgi:hypothetical protein
MDNLPAFKLSEEETDVLTGVGQVGHFVFLVAPAVPAVLCRQSLNSSALSSTAELDH